MRSCRAERRAATLLGLVLALFAGPAAGQTGAPVPLFPAPTAPAPTPQPGQPAVPALTQPGAAPAAQPAAPAGQPAAPAAQPPAPGSVEATPLAPPPSDGIGTLEGSAGFGPTLWRGSSRSLVEALVPQIPSASSPAMRDLARRVLLTSAAAPEGAGTTPLLKLRADRLLGLGMAREAADLLALMPGPERDAATTFALIEASLLAGAPDPACQAAESHAALLTDAEGQRIQVFCTLKAGDRDRAYLLYDLLREQGQEDPGFAAAFAMMDGDASAKLPQGAQPRPLLIAMLATAARPAPEDWFKTVNSALLAAMLRLPPGKGEARLGAIERGARLGLIAPAALLEAYGAAELPRAERASVETRSAPSPRQRAAVFQAATAATTPLARATLLQTLLAAAEAPGLRLPMRAALAPTIAQLTPSPDLAKFAPDFARALIAGGNAAAARGWITLARGSAGEPAVASALPGLALLQSLTGTLDPAWTAAARRFAEQPLTTPEGQRLAAITRLFPPGAPAPAQSGSASLASSALFDPGLGLALRNAAAAARLGETVLFGLVALGDAGPGGSDAGALAEALQAFRRVKLENEARTLALEAALANGA